MPNTIEFYFDFSSPYSYLASEQIDALAAGHGRTVDYRPALLGAVFKISGGAPLTEQYGPKADYSKHDFARSARFAGIPYRTPSRFPVGTVAAARAALWLQRNAPELATPFIHAIFRAYFADDRDISDPAVVADVARGLGIDAEALATGAQQPEIKELLKKRVDEAIEFGFFGAP